MGAAGISNYKVAVVGLGYVGLPLAVAMSFKINTLGFDINRGRVDELKIGHDRTGEVDVERMKSAPLGLTCDTADVADCNVYIVTVPTPVDGNNQPDLGPVKAATRTLAPMIGKGDIIVYESTVYPGVTEDICGPLLAELSGLTCGTDFFLGYSPERINPGDKEHTVDRITKVIAGQTPEVTEALADIYGAVTSGGVFRAASIKAAEAAKVIENAQRDINIAFVNEIAKVFQEMDLSVYDVLEAAATKWNFLNFFPGLVGGHCIGVDPYYLAHRAKELGHHPKVILAGRHTNDSMGDFVAEKVASLNLNGGRALMLGLTFKENIPDLRNSKVIDVISGLEARGFSVDVHDAHADAAEAKHEYGVKLLDELDSECANGPVYDVIIAAVSHDEYVALQGEQLRGLLKSGGLIADIKAMWRDKIFPADWRRWQL